VTHAEALAVYRERLMEIVAESRLLAERERLADVSRIVDEPENQSTSEPTTTRDDEPMAGRPLVPSP
jgi:hypothetical protein